MNEMHVLSSDDFDDLMRGVVDDVGDVRHVAVAVSGGGDSMALLWLLQAWAQRKGITVHALSVDHGLRDASKGECDLVSAFCQSFEHVEHTTLSLDGISFADGKIQERARHLRYQAMFNYCAEHAIDHLFLAHHQDDQAETFLFRLAKGSGIDGLSGMRPVQAMGGVMLCRPLLSVRKDELLSVCQEQGIDYIHDPSNENEAFARVRLRHSYDILAEEGLSAKRLGVTARRISRAREALEYYAENAYKAHLSSINTKRIEFNKDLLSEPDEIVLRVVLQAIDYLRQNSDKGAADYAPRMERVEDLLRAMQSSSPFRKRTLGGVIFDRDDDNRSIIMVCENPA